jgi:hypothetical protein
MARKLSRAATAAAALALGAAAAVATPALASTAKPAPGPTWTSVSPALVSGTVTAFAAAEVGNANTQWAFVTTANEVLTGYPSVYSRVNNGSWTKTALPGSSAGEVFVSATAISPTNVLAFTRLPGAGGREWQYDGSTWKVIKAFDESIGDATVIDADDAWVFGNDASGGGDLGVYHYNGTTWTKLASTLEGGQGMSGSTPTAWAYGSNKVAFYNGTEWVPTILPIPGNDTRVTDVWDANGTIYAVATNEQDETVIFISGNGKTWSIAAAYPGAVPLQNQIANDGQNGVWIPVTTAGDTSAVLHYILSTKALTETSLPGTIDAIHELDVTNELVGGYVPSSKDNPPTYAEIEYYGTVAACDTSAYSPIRRQSSTVPAASPAC